MTNKKSLKRAFILNVLSTLLCISMLLGTTFAWFTDTVESGVNQIVAGNLDVELKHKSASVTTADTVEDATNLFLDVNGQPMKWEPGAYTYEVFTVSNIGNLALKYQLSAILADYDGNTDGDQFFNTVIDPAADPQNTGISLLTALYVKEIAGDAAPATRPTYSAADGVTLEAYLNGGSVKAAALEPGASTTTTIIIYWPQGENDNNWNLQNGKYASDATADTVGSLKVGLAIRLIAAQYTSEIDSFDNQYDASADTSFDVSSALTPVLPNGATTATTSNNAASVEIPANTLSDSIEFVKLIAEGLSMAQVEENVTVSYTEVNLVDQDGNAVDLTGNTNEITTILFVGTGITGKITVVLDEGTANAQTFVYDPTATTGNTMSYDSVAGEVTFKVVHFCPAKITIENVVASTGNIAENSLAFYNVDTVEDALASGENIVIYNNNTDFQSALEEAAEDEYAAVIVGKEYYTDLVEALNSAVNGDTIKILKDVTITTFVNSTSSYNKEPAAADGGNLGFGTTIDGDNHTITLDSTGYNSFLGCFGGNMKNLTVKGLKGPLLQDSYTGASFDHVTIEGEQEVSGNCGGFVTYVWAGTGNKFTFNDCVVNMDFHGIGTSADYNAAFVGYFVKTDYEATFTRCENKGNIICGSAGMFIGNVHSYTAKIYINECKNTGLINRTYVPEETYRHNNILYGTTSDWNATTYIDGVEYTMSQVNKHEADNAIAGSGMYVVGNNGVSLGIVKNPDGTFTVTTDSSIATYTVHYGLYTSLNAGGSTRTYVTQSFATEAATYTTALTSLKFVDSTWVDNNPGAVESDASWDNTFKIYTLGNESYYLIPNTATGNLNGEIGEATLISVSGFDINGVLLASTGLAE